MSWSAHLPLPLHGCIGFHHMCEPSITQSLSYSWTFRLFPEVLAHNNKVLPHAVLAHLRYELIQVLSSIAMRRVCRQPFWQLGMTMEAFCKFHLLPKHWTGSDVHTGLKPKLIKAQRKLSNEDIIFKLSLCHYIS